MTSNLRRMSRLPLGQGGFTLIEVVVAMGILTIGILALIPALLFNIKANTLSRNRGLANELAKQRLEEVKSWPLYNDFYEGSTLANPGVTSNNAYLFGTEFVHLANTHVEFTRTTSVRGNIDACGSAVLFGSSANGVTRNLNEAGTLAHSLNTGNVNHDSSCTGGQYQGEDFRLIRVTVSWIDQFGGHSLQRHQYIRTH